MNGTLNNFSYEYYFQKVTGDKVVLLTRVRNEEVIMQDFLDHVSHFCDGIIVLDDDSTDRTVDICRNHEKVCAIIRNNEWTSEKRSSLETLHRDRLHKIAKNKFNFCWYFYMDADERIDGKDIKSSISSLNIDEVHYIRIPLFDAYLTADDNSAFTKKSKLLNSRDYFGVERRDIIFLWNDNANAEYILDDAREPSIESEAYVTLFACQHYGKAISSEKWDAKCRYYIDNFPYDAYGRKWEQRLGKAIHDKSDFGTPLYKWGNQLFDNAIKIHPL